MRHNFKQRMASAPHIKLTSHTSPSGNSMMAMLNCYTNVWLQNVTDMHFDFCYREGIAFTGRHNLTVHYVAAAGSRADVFSEHGMTSILKSNSKPHNQHHSSYAGSAFCEKVVFNQMYDDVPFVFTTPMQEPGQPNGELMSYIKEVSRTHMEVCARNSNDEVMNGMTKRTSDVHVHFLVRGHTDVCQNHHCPNYLQCHVDRNTNTPYCGCIEYECVEEEFCGSDMTTYHSRCQVYKDMCHRHGVDHMNNFNGTMTVMTSKNMTATLKIVHNGECKAYPYDSGFVTLEDVPGVPVAFCKQVSLNPSMFNSNEQMHVLLTVVWQRNNMDVHDATASWSEQVSVNGFKACVMVAGRHFTNDIGKRPNLYWVAYQVAVIKNAEPRLQGGVVDLPTWYTGSRCVSLSHHHNMNYQSINGQQARLLVSVEHTNKESYKDAMTAWVEYSESGTVKLCARELQNFDGIHQGVRLHWLNIHSLARPYISEASFIHFPGAQFNLDQPMGPVCQTTKYNTGFPSLGNPVVLMTVKNATNTWYSSDFSHNDFSVWIEESHNDEMTICMKSIRAGIYRQPVNVTYAIFPTLCAEGFEYLDGKCYTKIAGLRSKRDQANTLCSLRQARLPIVENAAEANYLEMMSGADDTWIGYQDDLVEGTWQWDDGSAAGYTNWMSGEPDGGMSENCAVTAGGADRGWKDEDCDDVKLVACTDYCKNGAQCIVGIDEVECKCPPGFT